jgi:hypothetical protein
MSVPLFSHARRLAHHTGHAEETSWWDALVGLFWMYVIVVVLWKMAFG